MADEFELVEEESVLCSALEAVDSLAPEGCFESNQPEVPLLAASLAVAAHMRSFLRLTILLVSAEADCLLAFFLVLFSAEAD